MNILSFDQSTTCSGYCLMQDGKYVESGFIDKHQNKDINTRTFEMANAICTKIKEIKPDLVVIEGVQNQSNINTVIQLSRLQGALMFYCFTKKIKIEVLTPSQWRKALHFSMGGKVKRAELKQQGINYIKEHLGIERPEDEAEAVCIGIAANMLYNTK